MKKAEDDIVAASAVRDWQDKLAEHIHRKGGEKKCRGRLILAMDANREKMKAVDKILTMSLAVGGLKSFQAHDAVGALQENIDRFSIAVDKLPAEMRTASIGRARRSCLLNRDTKETKLEIAWASTRPSLWCLVDQGSVGWPAKLRAYYKAKIRGSESVCYAHRRIRNRELALTKSGVLFSKMEFAIIFSFLHGPFGSDANWTCTKGALQEYLDTFSSSDLWFKICYDFIIHDKTRGKLPANYGTKESYDQVWEWCRESRLLSSLGSRAKNNRWHSQQIKFRELREELGVLLLAVGYIGMCRGSFSVGDLPGLCSTLPAPEVKAVAAEVKTAASSAASSSTTMPLRSVKDSSAHVERLRDTSANTAHFVAKCLARRTTTRLFTGVVLASEPLEEDLNVHLHSCKTRAGAYDWHVLHCSGEWVGAVQKTWDVLQDIDFVDAAGFNKTDEVLSDEISREDSLLAEALFDFVMSYIANEILSSSFYSLRPPFVCLAALHRDPAVQRRTMAYLRALWDSVTEAESAARAHPFLRDHLSSMVWPQSVISREWLLAAWECEWKCFPPDILAELESAAQGWGNIQPIESAHGVLTDACRQSKTGKLTKQSKFHRVITSSLIEDTDRKQPCITTQTKAAAIGKQLGTNAFLPNKGPHSFDEADFDEFCSGELPFSTAARGYFVSSAATSALLTAKDDFQRLKTMFFSLLAEPGSLLVCRGDDPSEATLVVDRSEFAVTCWSVTLMKRKGQCIVSMKPRAGKDPWRLRHIWDLDRWFVLKTVAAPPCRVKATKANGEPLGITLLVPNPERIALILDAAKHGFRGLTVQQMKRLAQELEVAVDRMPTLEVEVASLLIKHVVPDISDLELASALEYRARRRAKSPKFDTDLTNEVVQQAAGTLGNEFGDVFKELQDYSAQVEAVKKRVAQAKASAAPAKKKKALTPKDAASVEAARKHLPVTPGAALHMETTWHSRWRATYPVHFPPFSKSASFEPKVPESRSKALKAVLEWVWRNHTEITGEVCPYDFA